MTSIAEFYFDGTVDGDKEFRLFAKCIWFEHIKRRPAINAKIGRTMVYSLEEQRIIKTPLDQLMSEYAKTLS